MKITQSKCVGCFKCIPYCPLEAIDKKYDVTIHPTVFIDQDKCVECAVCLRTEICKTDAIYQPELSWPRSIRQAFSAVLIGYGVYEKELGIYEYKITRSRDKSTVTGGRGTSEMKTNDVTGRYKDGEVGISAELGRPGVGFYFKDLEKLTIALAEIGVKFEPENPVTVLLDQETGRIKYREILNEKALSAIVETIVKKEKTIEVLKKLKAVAREIDTVFSVDIICKCKNGVIPIKSMLDNADIKVRINGKTNLGFGRPLIQ